MPKKSCVCLYIAATKAPPLEEIDLMSRIALPFGRIREWNVTCVSSTQEANEAATKPTTAGLHELLPGPAVYDSTVRGRLGVNARSDDQIGLYS